MTSYLDKYCTDFDLELQEVVENSKEVQNYNNLVREINEDQELKKLTSLQRKYQQELMNLQALRQTGFSEISQEKLALIDQQIATNNLLIRLQQENHVIKLQANLISDVVDSWKEEYVFKD